MTPQEKAQILDGLIRNGLRHLDRGLSGFEAEALEFAVCDAFFGIEIILKAFVFEKRWDLIFMESAAASVANLKSGECRTIGRKEAIKRLKSDLGLSIPASVVHIALLEGHRNKLVHFFHPNLSSKKHIVARDLSNAWGALRDLRSLPQFEPALRDYGDEFRALDGRLLIIGTFLDQQAATIRSEHPHPDRLWECPACKRETFDGDCLLCGYAEPSHRDICNGDYMIPPADCPDCGETEGVVSSNDHCRCTSCGHTFDHVGICEFCGEPFVSSHNVDDEADMGSYQLGCGNCGGNFAYQMSKDD